MNTSIGTDASIHLIAGGLVLILLLGAGYFIARRVFGLAATLAPGETAAAVEAGRAVLVDVREPAEWKSGVARCAVLLPLSDLRGPRALWAPFLREQRSKRILLYCQSGIRSGLAASILKSEGFETVNLGAFAGLEAGGLPVRKP